MGDCRKSFIFAQANERHCSLHYRPINDNTSIINIMEIGIFCSANDNIEQDYFEKARELGHWIADQGHSIVFGGSNTGLMECIAKAMQEHGGRTIGVVPRILERGRRVSEYCEVTISCEDLSDRKALMMERADIFIALPGGVGTLDEIFTVAASHSIGFHTKKVILYNIDGFWDETIRLLDDMQRRNFIRGKWTDMIEVAGNLDEIKKKLG